MRDALNKIKRNLKNFLGEYQLCEETWETNYLTKLFYLNKEFPSQFQGLYILLCLSCLTWNFQICTFLQQFPIINLLKIQLARA